MALSVARESILHCNLNSGVKRNYFEPTAGASTPDPLVANSDGDKRSNPQG